MAGNVWPVHELEHPRPGGEADSRGNRTRRVRRVEPSEAGREDENPSELVERELEDVRLLLSWARRDLDVARSETERALALVDRIRAGLQSVSR